MKIIACVKTKKNGWNVLQIYSLFLFLPILRAQDTLVCPDLAGTKCSCHSTEKGETNSLHLSEYRFRNCYFYIQSL